MPLATCRKKPPLLFMRGGGAIKLVTIWPSSHDAVGLYIGVSAAWPEALVVSGGY